MKRKLTIEHLKKAAKEFCETESTYNNKDLYGVTDGKAVGTYIEHKFQEYLNEKYKYQKGSSAEGIDLPEKEINTDIKVTSINQPQSSCPFKDAKQKIFGLGYNLLVFVYHKNDNIEERSAVLDFLSCTFINKERTADYTLTYRIREMIDDNANKDDIISFMNDKNIPADEITMNQIADQVLTSKPALGFITISNALQWRLQYSRIVYLKENVSGITKLIDKTTQ